MNILEQIAAQTRERIEAEKRQTPTEELIRQIKATEQKKSKQSFYEALKKPGMSYICEVKSVALEGADRFGFPVPGHCQRV